MNELPVKSDTELKMLWSAQQRAMFPTPIKSTSTTDVNVCVQPATKIIARPDSN